MKIYSENENYKLYHGNMLDMLEEIPPQSIDSIVTDPPYGLTSIVKRFGSEDAAPCKKGKDGRFARLSKGFMGKEWDGSGIEYSVETWGRCYDVLKPGGYLLAFGGSRTFHRIACAIEDAGFEIRDTIMWLYGSGFPKSMNIGLAIDKKNGVDNRIGNIVKGVGSNNTNSMKSGLGESQEFANTYEEREAQNEWKGWGTALKPAFEPIIVARKPFKGSCVDNVIKWGVGGINIDECRVPYGDETDKRIGTDAVNTSSCGFWSKDKNNGVTQMYKDNGRFPANVILTYDQITFDEVCGGMPYSKSNGGKTSMPDLRDIGKKSKEVIGIDKLSFGQVSNAKRKESQCIAPSDEGSACRYFYCAKASKKDRDEGLDNFENVSGADITGRKEGSAGLVMENGKQNPFAGKASPNNKNTHPTVKPTELMQYLVRLVTPKNGVVLDPFNGSGSTGKAVMYENRERDANYKYIGIELTEEYLPIAKARIEWVKE